MIEEILRKIGLTEGEIKVYLALSELGSVTSGKITKKSGVSGSKVYEIIDRLKAKGLATHVERNGVKYFEATSPERIFTYLEEKENEIKKDKMNVAKLIPELVAMRKGQHESDVKVFTGWEGIKAANDVPIKKLSKGEEWLVLGMGVKGIPIKYEPFFHERQKVRVKKGIIQKLILNKDYREVYRRRKNMKNTEIRFILDEVDLPTGLDVYGDSSTIYILGKEPMAILIENKHVADNFRKYFYSVWKIATRKSPY